MRTPAPGFTAPDELRAGYFVVTLNYNVSLTFPIIFHLRNLPILDMQR